MSSSWSWSPLDATALQIFTEMVTQGQSFFQASGDLGAYADGIMPPADVPNLTTVGGTILTTAGPGGAWQSETTWAGSGGGVSTTYPIPSYQQTVNTTAAGGSATMRNIPDVALLAEQIFLICDNGYGRQLGGTSVAAPLWAGFMALANQQAATNGTPRIGFANPALYAIGAGSSYQNDLHDITTGDNTGFNALPGYDLATGWGSPAGQPLINSLTGSTGVQSFGLATSASTLAIIAGTSGNSTITISAQNGFSNSVNLTASGLPAGVTASFNPATATTTSTLTLTASSSAVTSTSTNYRHFRQPDQHRAAVADSDRASSIHDGCIAHELEHCSRRQREQDDLDHSAKRVHRHRGPGRNGPSHRRHCVLHSRQHNQNEYAETECGQFGFARNVHRYHHGHFGQP